MVYKNLYDLPNYASHNGHEEVVKHLISHGANSGVVNHQQKSALSIAKDKGHEKVVGYLEAWMSQNALNRVISSQKSSGEGLRL